MIYEEHSLVFTVRRLSQQERQDHLDAHYDFKSSAYPKLITRENLQSIRLALWITNVLLLGYSISNLTKLGTIIYFTNWAHHFTNISLFFSFLAGTFYFQESQTLRRLAGLMVELAQVSQIVVFAFYWPLLHPDIVK